MEKLILTIPLVVAYLLDLWLADPEHWPHPVRWFGNAISAGDKAFNKGKYRFITGMLLSVFLVGITFLIFFFIDRWLWENSWPVWMAFTVLFAYWGLANQSLINESSQVFKKLNQGLETGRQQLARIVGRDTKALNEQDVRIATLETMAENLSDGVIAPIFYYALLGVPGMMAFKMISTLDSMMGYRNERYEEFGKFAARLDDVANYIPARLTVLLLGLASWSGKAILYATRFGHCHKSPNAGYPEAALAGILRCRFGGPNYYGGVLIEKPFIGDGQRSITDRDFTKVARLNHLCTLVLILTVTATILWVR
ncbi:cobalamin biosynthesis protein CobD [Fulvivirga sp. M361]|uniref:adenosylcobinamide-phosphate synthase CbiB n=1 Tax=Fulvivirga sp. M361 TaxID=2594266 RepID=UPI00117A1809|nr:adenosylcobinamide-phosphate synthase CbiB [Fulvivirga sp. M361]TRX62758.1 cobalamin biosynthesis protein CobD [Fulvivirga sp. M361]